MRNARETGSKLMGRLRSFAEVTDVRGIGLMIGLDVPGRMNELRNHLLKEYRIFTGEAKPDTIRLLPPLTLSEEQADYFIDALRSCLHNLSVTSSRI
jgi:acetylornithine aminotransferase